MMYVATIKHYDEWDSKNKVCYMLISADSIVKAVQQVSNHYGEEYVEDITIAPFSPDDFVMLEDDTCGELFHDFTLHAGENVVW